MKRIEQKDLDELSSVAKSINRLRKNLNLHSELSDPVQRLINAFEPASYLRPHRHTQDGRWELFVILRGEAIVLLFDDVGVVTQRHRLNPNDTNVIIEIPANTWHTLFATKAGTVLFEVKQGPYIPLDDKDFAGWAPMEGGQRVNEFIRWFATAAPGSAPPVLMD